MKIVDASLFTGPSRYSNQPTMAVTLDPGPLAGWKVGQLDAGRRVQLAKLLFALPAAALDPDTRLPDLFAQLLTALQRTVGCLRVPASVHPQGVRHLCTVTTGYETGQLALQAARVAAVLTIWLVPAVVPVDAGIQTGLDPGALIRGFVAGSRALQLDQTTQALIQEAERRGIPWFRPHDHDRMVQFGQGAHQIRIRETLTDHTSAIAWTIARSKWRTHRLLVEFGLPTTRPLTVANRDEAVRSAERIGYPVVVKPDDRGGSLAVSVGLMDRAGVVVAFQKARSVSATVLVEAVVPGENYRLLVVDGRLVAAAQRVAAHVVGDGRHTVEELVDELNRDPHRGTGFANLLVRVDLDDEALRMLAGAGLARTSIPGTGQKVWLRGAASISAGGTSIDVTAEVHPENRIAAEQAARVVGLDIAGVDFISPDIRRSWREAGGAILEVNPSPGLRPHWNAEGSPDVTAAVMDSLVPPGRRTRIPVAAITGSTGKTTTTMLTAHILGQDGRVVGSATTYGVHIGAELAARGDRAGGRGCTMVLLDPRVEAAVLETARGGLIQRGLIFDWCDVGAVLNVGSDHLGMDDLSTLEELAQIKRLVVEHARHMAVLNADDQLCVQLADGLTAKRLCYVSMVSDNPRVRRHVDAGHPAVWLDETDTPIIVLHDGSAPLLLSPVADLPIAMGGAARFNIQNAMFAAAISFGLGESPESIRVGLRTFLSDMATNPGRFNLYDRLPFRVMVDCAHNAEGYQAVAQFVRRLDVQGRRSVILWSSGNRADAHYPAVSHAAAAGFDRFICTEPPNPRGRPPGDISRRLAEGLRESGVGEERIAVVADKDQAVALALNEAGPGDFVLISTDEPDRVWRQLTSFQPGTVSP